MEILVERKWKKPNYTIGVMSIDGKRFCETLEDVDRNLNSSMTVEQIKAIKKPNETAIFSKKHIIAKKTKMTIVILIKEKIFLRT